MEDVHEQAVSKRIFRREAAFIIYFPMESSEFYIYKSNKVDIMWFMEPSLIYKALSNETRRLIMLWLKKPEEFFDEQAYLKQGLNFQIGVCVGDIQAKAGLAQSVISSYLLTMQKSGLLESERIGKWTYYRRNEKTIQQFAEYIQKEL
ncbi:DNA-binding transcriptional ArsR family regulator [Paenibacillus brasilensis]|uniref:DNA-binding transcriptional ArsR family regulator n=2 Tax=Paenibacillus TaxID=44249 RepID=A0ABU0L286_9BACL|nr:DNA-binding transcriptional ArsR family regulator [Paenibacillus brasilensis]